MELGAGALEGPTVIEALGKPIDAEIVALTDNPEAETGYQFPTSRSALGLKLLTGLSCMLASPCVEVVEVVGMG